MSCNFFISCADSGIFVRGRGPGPSVTTCFFVCFYRFLVQNLFYRCQMVTSKENYHFRRLQRGAQHFPGGGGSNCLFPTENHITCDFPGGPDILPPPPPWIRICIWQEHRKQHDFLSAKSNHNTISPAKSQPSSKFPSLFQLVSGLQHR